MLTLSTLTRGSRPFPKSILFPASFIAVICLLNLLSLPRPSNAAADSPNFKQRTDSTLNGNLVMSGNTLLHCDPSDPKSNCGGGNNRLPQKYVNRGPASSQRIFNSSSAVMDLPAGAMVKYAGLYWGASLHENPSDKPEDQRGTAPADCKDRNENCKQKRRQVLFRYPGKTDYELLTADELIHPTNENDERSYHCFKDVTDLLQNKSGRLDFSVGNVQAARGIQRHASWNLVLVYENPTEPSRRISLFDGYFGGPNVNQAITLEGFNAPSNKQNAYLWTFAYEGDRQYNSDSLMFNGSNLLLHSGDIRRGRRNFFNSQIFDVSGITGRPDNQQYRNNVGVDIHRDQIHPDAFGSGASIARLTLNTVPQNNELGPDGVTLAAAAIVVEMDSPVIPKADLFVTKTATPMV